MGYNTEFSGRFLLNKPLDEETYKYLLAFSETRHMKRNPALLGTAGHKYGIEGEFYVSGVSKYEDEDTGVVDHNHPPSTQPSLWCQWIPSEDHLGIEWDGGEKFYEYEAWLKYLLKNFLLPKGYILSGIVPWTDDYDYSGELNGLDIVKAVCSENPELKINTSIPKKKPKIGTIVYEESAEPKKVDKMVDVMPTRKVLWK
jgi:hypothetical protein